MFDLNPHAQKMSAAASCVRSIHWRSVASLAAPRLYHSSGNAYNTDDLCVKMGSLMPELSLIKRHGLLLPSSEMDEEIINSMQDGCIYKTKISKTRNQQFHRKYFALLDVLYNFFDPKITPMNNGMMPKKDRERFRKDLIIATGNYELVVNIKGDVRAEAKSISFAAMDEVEFAKLYEKTINYGLKHIATGKTREQIDEWVDQIMSFT